MQERRAAGKSCMVANANPLPLRPGCDRRPSEPIKARSTPPGRAGTPQGARARARAKGGGIGGAGAAGARPDPGAVTGYHGFPGGVRGAHRCTSCRGAYRKELTVRSDPEG